MFFAENIAQKGILIFYEHYNTKSKETSTYNWIFFKTWKKWSCSYGEIPIDVPQDRDGDFEPQIVQKRKKDISAIEQKIIAMSAKGMTKLTWNWVKGSEILIMKICDFCTATNGCEISYLRLLERIWKRVIL